MDNTYEEKLKKCKEYFNMHYNEYAKERGRKASQSEFATLMGVPQTTMSFWLNGRRFPTYDNAKIIANKTGDLSIFDILDYDRPMPDDENLRYIVSFWHVLDEDAIGRILDLFAECVHESYILENGLASPDQIDDVLSAEDEQ